MKKTLAILLAVLSLLVLLASCAEGGGGGDILTLPPEDSEGDAGSDYVFLYQGVSIQVGELWLGKAGGLFSRIGEPVTSTATPSCAYQGLDKTFTYPGFIVKTYPDNENDYVLNIQFTDDSVATPSGIRIGSTETELTAVYGEGEKNGNTVVYTQGRMQVAVVVEDGKVKNLNYNYLEE